MLLILKLHKISPINSSKPNEMISPFLLPRVNKPKQFDWKMIIKWFRVYVWVSEVSKHEQMERVIFIRFVSLCFVLFRFFSWLQKRTKNEHTYFRNGYQNNVKINRKLKYLSYFRLHPPCFTWTQNFDSVFIFLSTFRFFKNKRFRFTECIPFNFVKVLSFPFYVRTHTSLTGIIFAFPFSRVCVFTLLLLLLVTMVVLLLLLAS